MPAASARAAHSRPGSGVCRTRVSRPWRDWLSTIHALPTRPVSNIRRVQNSTLASGSTSSPSRTETANPARAVQAARTRPVISR
ncbi:hypothetical protein SRIMM317S_05437 [Streptomyces rimosus subsp. rimosus]